MFCLYFRLWDQAHREDSDRLRPLSYPQTDVFVLCFSVADRKTFDACFHKHLPQMVSVCPKTPIILCGMKSDLRTNKVILIFLIVQINVKFNFF